MCAADCRLLALEQEKQQLQKKLQDPAAPERPPLAETQSMRDDLARASREIQRLQGEVEQARQQAGEAEEAATARVAGLQRSLAAAEEARVAQASELAARPTVQALDELRREVQALQALQFGSVELASAGDGGEGGAGVLEKAAAARVRALEHQLTVRGTKSDLHSIYELWRRTCLDSIIYTVSLWHHNTCCTQCLLFGTIYMWMDLLTSSVCM